MVVLDICHTLYNRNTTFDFIDYLLDREKSLNFCRVKIVKLCLIAVGKIIKRDLFRMAYIYQLKGYEKEFLRAAADTYVEKKLSRFRIAQVHVLLEQLKKQDCNLILCSASLDFLVEAIAHSLKVDIFYSTKLLYAGSQKICEGRISKDLLGNKSELFEENELEMVITDNISDIDLIKKSQKSYVVSKPKNINFWIENNIKVDLVNE